MACSESCGDQHSCPKEASIDYIAVVIDESDMFVLMERCSDDCVTFPVIRSGEVPHFASEMSACFASKIAAKCGTVYNLWLLYCTLNEVRQEHVPLPHCASFVALAPRGRNGEGLLNPSNDKFEWVYKPDIESGAEMLKSDDDYNGDGVAFRSTNRYMHEGAVQQWELPKWHRGVPVKAVEQLGNLGHTVKGPFVQYRLTATSTILKTRLSNDEVVYLKCSHSREVLITKTVSEFASFGTPAPLYCNVHEGWMVVRHHGETLDGKMTKEDAFHLLEMYGALQLRSISYVEELNRGGACVNTAAAIIRKSENFLDDEEVLASIHSSYLQTTDSLGRMSAGKKERLRSTVSSFFNLLFGKCGIPTVLVHRDIFDENVIKVQKKLTIIDWGQARLDIPFGDIGCLRTECFPMSDTNEATGELEDSRAEDLGIENYLNMWNAYGSIDFLRKVYKASTLKSTYESILDDYDYHMNNRLCEKLGVRSRQILTSIFHDMEQQLDALSKSVTL